MTWDFILLWELNCYCCVMLHVSLPSRPSQQVQIKRATNTVSVHLQMTEKVEELWSQLFLHIKHIKTQQPFQLVLVDSSEYLRVLSSRHMENELHLVNHHNL